MISDEYYKPVEKRLFERQCDEWDRLGTGCTEELPSEMEERHAQQWEALETRRMTCNLAEWCELYPHSRTQEWEPGEDTRQQRPEGTVDEHETSRLETFAKGLGQDVFDRAAKAGRGHLAKQSESLHEHARAERNEENERGLELER